MHNHLFTLFVLIPVFVAGCSSEPEALSFKNEIRVFTVSDFDFTMNDRSAVDISFGDSDQEYSKITEYCSLTLDRASISSGYSARVNGAEWPRAFNLDCHFAGNFFVLSSKHDTYAEISIRSLDTDRREAGIRVSGRVVNVDGKGIAQRYFRLEDVALSVTEEAFEHLVTIPKT